jgi:hypothetical protein
MGLDFHGINFLRYVAKDGRPFGEVATLGRQGLHIPVSNYGPYCETFLIDQFTATKVDSFDYSNNEQPTHILDLNERTEIKAAYDTVIDAGTMEHVFNAVQGLKTTIQLVRVGGCIIHILPANNFCNHGFWQFSPELFFSLYSQQNGFDKTEVFIADVGENEFWYEVTAPPDGHWDYLASRHALSVLAKTTKRRDMSKITVQQARFVSDWNVPPVARIQTTREKAKGILANTPLFKPARTLWRAFSDPDKPLRKNRNLKRRKISDLILVSMSRHL